MKLEGKAFESFSSEKFWKEKNLDTLAVEQGVDPPTQLDDILGKGADLWDTEDEFEAFVAATHGAEPKGP